MTNLWPYVVAMLFLGTYPVAGALLWIAGASAFSFYREGARADERFYALEHPPRVAVLIAAFEEELTIARTLRAVMALDWPDLEVLVVDDGSSDGTAEIVREFAQDPRVRLHVQPENGGKAAALNAGLPVLTSDYVLMMDADGAPAPDALRWLVPHLVRLPTSPPSPATRASPTGARCCAGCSRSSSRPRCPSCAARRRPGGG
jgi:biofilm PGA synthesis N-glycosyltransferase PgaC